MVAFLRTPSVYAEWLRLTGPRIPLIVSERAGVEAGGLTFADLAAGIGHLLATHITANSHDYLDRLRRKLPIGRRSTVLYNGIEPIFFRRGEERLAAGPRPVANRFCVVAARVTRQKGAVPLARALGLLSGQPHPAASNGQAPAAPIEVDWIGPVDDGSDYVGQAREAIGRLGPSVRWNWLGPRQDVDQVYGRYDALLLPSLYEGVANTMCEAMAGALPVIVTDIADNHRIVGEGREGLVCAPDDPSSLAAAIDRFRRLDAASRYAMGRTAHDRARELFSLDALVSGWEALCREVA